MQNEWKYSRRKPTYSYPVYTNRSVSKAMTCGAYFGAADQPPELSRRAEATLVAGRKLSSFSNDYSFESLTFQGGPSNA